MIKNILTSIEFEVSEDFQKCFGQWDEFANKLKDILEYYKLSIYKSGKTVLNSKIGINSRSVDLTIIDNEFLNKINFSEFIHKIESALKKYEDKLPRKELYDQVISIIIGECIILFKLAQINECKNKNIIKIKLVSDDNYSCNECKLYSKFTYDVENFNANMIHPYCKISILPICNKSTNIKVSNADFVSVPFVFTSIIKNITTKLSIQLKQFLTYKEFIFKEEINKIIIEGNKVYIPLSLIEKLDLESLIVRELLYNKLIDRDLTWWENTYKDKNKVMGDNCIVYSTPLINNKAQLNYKEYFVQSYISYILHPSILKDVDIEAYDQIKNVLGKEFLRG